MGRGSVMRWRVGLAVLLAGCASLPAQSDPSKARPTELTVWVGDRPSGNTWAKPGPAGVVEVADSDGPAGGKTFLRTHFTGEGYRGCGINWYGWYPPDAGTDASRHNALVFHVRQLSRTPQADLTVSLADSVKRPDGQPASN